MITIFSSFGNNLIKKIPISIVPTVPTTFAFTTSTKPTLFNYFFDSTDVSNNAVYNYAFNTYDLQMYKPVTLSSSNQVSSNNLNSGNSILTNNIDTTDSTYPSGSLANYTNNINCYGTDNQGGSTNGTVMFSSTSITLPTTGFTISFWFKCVYQFPEGIAFYNDPAGILHFVTSTTGKSTGLPSKYLSIFCKYSKLPTIIVIQVFSQELNINLDTSISKFDNGNWHFMALRFNTASLDLFVDNKWFKGTAFNASNMPTNTPLNITSGYNYTNWGTTYWAMKFKYLFGWNTALSDTYIQSLYAINYKIPTVVFSNYSSSNTYTDGTNNFTNFVYLNGASTNAIQFTGFTGNLYVLMVGGGGGASTGTSYGSAGGGGGEMVVLNYNLSKFTDVVNITIGTGGASTNNINTYTTRGSNGNDSLINFTTNTTKSCTAYGGGGGGAWNNPTVQNSLNTTGSSSGGGGRSGGSTAGTISTHTLPTTGYSYGNKGGNGDTSFGGGGGGAGAEGGSVTRYTGGDGKQIPSGYGISIYYYYGGGGGGGCNNSTNQSGNGGIGGGGAGSYGGTNTIFGGGMTGYGAKDDSGTNGITNSALNAASTTGNIIGSNGCPNSGGGGGSGANINGNGGSGIIIFSVLTSAL